MTSISINRAAALAVAISFLSVAAYSQSTRSKAKPLATPLPVLSSAEIISRADDQIEFMERVNAAERKAETPKTGGENLKDLTNRVRKLEADKNVD
ncbi:MAG: hypothetical protein ABIV48_12700, partial [Pyrinomonadaceae bacterium]